MFEFPFSSHFFSRSHSVHESQKVSPSAQSQTLCVFCAIVAGNAPAELIESTPDVLAFLDQRPVFKGHVLVIPREHVATLTDLAPAARDPFLAGIQRIAAAITSGLGAQGSFVAMNNVVSQSVPHLHCHVVPRTKGDGLRGFFWPRVRYDSPEEMREYADRLRAVL
ncbi:MAG: HIT family protein [Dermatophilaceae bacterium]|nr:HIT family protein [Actinomycetales bacterium]MBP8881228.1 HIT family protein [Dermatophilaceae bacterium]MBP9918406.1 HIT family protein [Dermatophilaceae bacterium]